MATSAATTFEHKQLYAGEVKYPIMLKGSAGEYKRGTLLESADGKVYAPAAEVATSKFYAICAEDLTLEGEGAVVAYKQGYFNKRIVAEATGEGVVTDDGVEILKTQNIFLETTITQ